MKKLIGLLTICTALFIAVCSIGVTKASAEEQAPEARASIYGDNLFTSISYREDNFVEPSGLSKVIHSQNFNGDTKETNIKSNFMSYDSTKDMLISMEFKIEQNRDIFGNDSLRIKATGTGLSYAEFYDEDFNVMGKTYFLDYAGMSAITKNNGESIVCVNALLPNDYIQYNNAKYFVVVPKLSYPSSSGITYYENGNAIYNMHVSLVEEYSYKDTDLSTITVDYRPYEPGMTWSHLQVENIDSNYLKLKNTNPVEFMALFVKNFNISDRNGEKVTNIEYGSINPVQMQVQGGVYEYIVKATSNDGYDVDFLLISVVCSDNDGPTIIGTTEYNVPSGSILNVNSIKSTLTAIDNVSSESEITISLKYDYYSSNYKKPGTYYVCFVAQDADGNMSDDFVVKINVLDKQAPKFYDSNNRVVSSTKVYKSPDSVLVLSDITNNLRAVDDIDGELEIKVYNNTYVGNGDKPGQYYIALRAVDKSGNASIYNVTVIVSEEMPSQSILIDGKTIIVDKHVKLVKEDFHVFLQVLNKYNPNTTSYTNINSSIYTASYKEVGDYLVDYNIISTNGQETTGVFTVKVIESRTDGSFVDDKEKEPGVIESILTWIWNLLISFFEFIGSLFTGGKK